MSDNRKIIYLDLNVFSDFRDRLNAQNQETVDLYATLLWLKRNWNVVIPYSDIHVQELCMTGKGRKQLSQDEIEQRVQNDLKIILKLTEDEKISKNSHDGLFYINTNSILRQYEVYKEFSFFMDTLDDLLNPQEYELLNYTRELFGFGPKVLNNCEDSSQALRKVDELKNEMPTKFEKLTFAQKEKLKQLRIKSLVESTKMIEKMGERLRNFINSMLMNFDFNEDQVHAINLGLSSFNIENEKALRLNEQMIAKNLELDDFIGISNVALSDLLKNVKVEHGLSLDKKHIENLMLNMWGFESKGLKFGMSSDHFDIAHSEFIPISYAFITNEVKNFKKRFSEHSNRIFSPKEFLKIMRDLHKVHVSVNFELKDESKQSNSCTDF